ncbi:hypothetical protein ACRRTK_004307 [Alexandromys fortis]
MSGTMRSRLSSWGPRSLLLLLLLARAAYTVSTAPLQDADQRDQPSLLPLWGAADLPSRSNNIVHSVGVPFGVPLRSSLLQRQNLLEACVRGEADLGSVPFPFTHPLLPFTHPLRPTE